MYGGELYVPRLKSYKIIDLAKAIDKKNKIDIIGIRPGEKLHEEMISRIDSLNTYKLKDLFIIVDPWNKKLDMQYSKFEKIRPNFSYNSFDNNDYLTIDELSKIVKKYM
jgi:UDP-N-acetylglucosamine 4,6-dehydratase